MTDLFLIPIGDDWIGRFEQTVVSGIETNGDIHPELEGETELRIWGTTEGSDERKRNRFEKMDQGDLVLFYYNTEFVGSGRIGTAFESSVVGEELWNSPGSRFIYTITDFQKMSLPREQVWDVLGYGSDYFLRGFSRASDEAISSLLQQYNSVEEAFQSFRGEGPESEQNEPEDIDEEASDDDVNEPREHTEIQWHLIQLGLEHGYDVYVATNDQNLMYDGVRLGDNCIEKLNLTGFSKSAMRIIQYVDVIWLRGDYIAKMFEVESTTSIYSGILRMTDFVIKVPNLAVDMHIVAPAEDEDKVRREMTRPTFQHIMDRAQHCSLQFLSFDDVRDKHDLVDRAGPLQSVF